MSSVFFFGKFFYNLILEPLGILLSVFFRTDLHQSHPVLQKSRSNAVASCSGKVMRPFPGVPFKKLSLHAAQFHASQCSLPND